MVTSSSWRHSVKLRDITDGVRLLRMNAVGVIYIMLIYILCNLHISLINDLDWLSRYLWYKFPFRFWVLCITSMLVVMPKKVLRFGCYQGGITPWLICVVYTMVIPKHKTFYSISIFISQQPCLRYCWPILATRVHANFFLSIWL